MPFLFPFSPRGDPAKALCPHPPRPRKPFLSLGIRHPFLSLISWLSSPRDSAKMKQSRVFLSGWHCDASAGIGRGKATVGLESWAKISAANLIAIGNSFFLYNGRVCHFFLFFISFLFIIIIFVDHCA